MKKRQRLHGCFKINVFSSVSKTPLMKRKQKKMRGCSAINFNINVCIARSLTVKIIWNCQILLARRSEMIVAEDVYMLISIICKCYKVEAHITGMTCTTTLIPSKTTHISSHEKFTI